MIGRWRKVRKRLPVPSRRERWALGCLVVPIAIGFALSLVERSSETTLIVEEPTPGEEMTIVAENGDGAGEIHAEPQIFSLRGAPPTDPEPVVSKRREVELHLPVAKAACPRLRRAFGGACGRSGTAAPQQASSLTVVWPSAGDVSVRTERLSSLSAAQTPVRNTSAPVTTWNLRVGSAKTVVELECIEESRFHLELGGVRRDPRCVYRSTLLRIPLLLAESQVAAISLAGVRSWDLLAKGQRADLAVERSELFVGGHHSPNNGTHIPVSISAENSHGLALEVDVPDGEADTDIQIETSKADSVEVDDEEVLPSLLSKFEDYWFLALGMVGGVLLSILLERAPPRN
ncbi:MAG TPA: hypothetical protein VF093_03925 [Solirubrobacterales bacterium]